MEFEIKLKGFQKEETIRGVYLLLRLHTCTYSANLNAVPSSFYSSLAQNITSIGPN